MRRANDSPVVLLRRLARMRCVLRRCGHRVRPDIDECVLSGEYPFESGTDEERLFDALYDQILSGSIRSVFELGRLDRAFDTLPTRACLSLLL